MRASGQASMRCSPGGVASPLWRLALTLLKIAAFLTLFSVGMVLAPRMTALAVAGLVGFYAYRKFGGR